MEEKEGDTVRKAPAQERGAVLTVAGKKVPGSNEEMGLLKFPIYVERAIRDRDGLHCGAGRGSTGRGTSTNTTPKTQQHHMNMEL
jgi:hypothetical protein